MIKQVMELLSPEEQENFISILEKISEKIKGVRENETLNEI